MAKILIVDDEETIREVIKKILEQTGHEIIEASEGEEALRLQAACEADLIITDLVMPGLNGSELIRRVRREYPKTRIIVISGFGGEGNANGASGLRADKILEKPFNILELLKAVEDLLPKVSC